MWKLAACAAQEGWAVEGGTSRQRFSGCAKYLVEAVILKPYS